MEDVVDAFESLLGADSKVSGECFEIGPKGGAVSRKGAEYLDDESRVLCELLEGRGRVLQRPEGERVEKAGG